MKGHRIIGTNGHQIAFDFGSATDNVIMPNKNIEVGCFPEICVRHTITNSPSLGATSQLYMLD
jgi:hypothetical protein